MCQLDNIHMYKLLEMMEIDAYIFARSVEMNITFHCSLFIWRPNSILPHVVLPAVQTPARSLFVNVVRLLHVRVQENAIIINFKFSLQIQICYSSRNTGPHNDNIKIKNNSWWNHREICNKILIRLKFILYNYHLLYNNRILHTYLI